MTRGPARTAVLIGNGAFPQAEGVLTPLAAPAHDVAVLAGLLSDPEVCRFDPPQTLVDRDSRAIKQTLLRTLNAARPQDLVLVYYAGHGKLEGSQLYLCARDTEPETLAATAVSIGDIREYVGRSSCKQVVLILDCCFSGAAADEFRTRGELSDRIEAAASARGLYLLTSCANHETSLEHVGGGEGDLPYGVYTRMLADGILSGQADVYQDGRITPLELARYLQSRIPGQTPRVSLIDAEGEEPVLAWTSWAQNDGLRARVRSRLVEWYADEEIPEDVFYQAMGLLGRVPLTTLERLRKRLLGMCAGAGWDHAVFTRGWNALEGGDGDPPSGLERFLTEQVAQGALDEGLYLEAMGLLAAEPEGELQQRRKRLLTRFARSPERDVTLLADAWHALDRREHPPVAEVSYVPSAGKAPDVAAAPKIADKPAAGVPEAAPNPPAPSPGPATASAPSPVTKHIAQQDAAPPPPASRPVAGDASGRTKPGDAPASPAAPDRPRKDSPAHSADGWNSSLREAAARERKVAEARQAVPAKAKTNDAPPPAAPRTGTAPSAGQDARPRPAAAGASPPKAGEGAAGGAAKAVKKTPGTPARTGGGGAVPPRPPQDEISPEGLLIGLLVIIGLVVVVWGWSQRFGEESYYDSPAAEDTMTAVAPVMEMDTTMAPAVVPPMDTLMGTSTMSTDSLNGYYGDTTATDSATM